MGSTMLEVAEPSFQGAVQFRADSFVIPAVAATGLAPYCVFELIQALLARPFLCPFKMVSQEVEAPSLTSVH